MTGQLFQQSQTAGSFTRIFLRLIDSTDGVSPKTAQTGTGFISKAGGTPAATTNSLVEVSSTNTPGLYYIQLTATELDTLGAVAVRYKAAGTLEAIGFGAVVPFDPYATTATTNNAIRDSILTDSTPFAGANIAAIKSDTGSRIIRSGTAQAGASTSITLDAGASAVTDFYKNDLVVITGSTGAGQARYITAYNGSTKVATVAAWATNPSATSTFTIVGADVVPGASAPSAAAVATAVWQDLTAGTDFSTAGSVGALVKTDLDATISSRLASAGYTAPDNADILLIKAKTDNLPAVAAGASGGLPTVDAANGVKVSVGTGTGQLSVTTGKVTALLVGDPGYYPAGDAPV